VGTNIGTALICWMIFSKGENAPSTVTHSGSSPERKETTPPPRREENAGPSVAAETASKPPGPEKKSPKPPSALENPVSEGGVLSSAVMDHYALSRDQYNKLQSAISSYWAGMAKSAAERITYDAVTSSASPDGAEVYRLPAMPAEEREQLGSELAASMRQIAGDETSKELFRGVSQGESFGYYGKYDMAFRFKPMKVNQVNADGQILGSYIDKSQMSVSYDVIDPQKGHTIVEGVTTSGELSKSYGNIFVVPVDGE
jgi:hypothetical protein